MAPDGDHCNLQMNNIQTKRCFPIFGILYLIVNDCADNLERQNLFYSTQFN